MITSLIPGLAQYRRGERLRGLVFGLCLILAVVGLYLDNRRLRATYGRMRDAHVPRDVAGEVLVVKAEHKRHGAYLVVLLAALALVDAFLGRKRGAP